MEPISDVHNSDPDFLAVVVPNEPVQRVKPSRATVVSADTTSRVVLPSSTTDKGQTNDTGTICSAVSQINACENGWTLVKSKSQKVNPNTTGID